MGSSFFNCLASCRAIFSLMLTPHPMRQTESRTQRASFLLPNENRLHILDPAMSTIHEINQKAQTVLRTALGPVDYARYQQQFSTGFGDYTAERQQAAEADTAAISKSVAERKAAGSLIPPPNARVLEGDQEHPRP
jgi:hypothetical protein